MLYPRQRLFLAVAALVILALVGYSSIREPADLPLSKIASAKERLQQSFEQQNKDLRHALSAARASLTRAVEAPALTPLPIDITPNDDQPPDPLSSTNTTSFAYVFYTTTDPYACSVLVNIHRLTRLLHTALAIHVLAAPSLSPAYLAALRAVATVHVQPPPPMPETAVHYYKDSLLKLRAFGIHTLAPELTRVLVLDADQLILRNLDHLFPSLPAVDLAAPRAYWLPSAHPSAGSGFLSSAFMLLAPSDRLWRTVSHAMRENLHGRGDVRYDMDLVNDVLGDEAMMLGGEFVCLNSHWEDWNLPRWYHAGRELNWTTIGRVNGLARPGGGMGVGDGSPGNKRRERRGGQEVTGKRQLFTNTDIGPLAPLPTAGPLPVPVPAPQQPHLRPHIPSSSPEPINPSLQLLDTLTPPLQPLEPTGPHPRFPLHHPLALELEALYSSAAAVLHFSAVGKPWTFTAEDVRRGRPDAHPLLVEQFEEWRGVAGEVCPGGVPEERFAVSEGVVLTGGEEDGEASTTTAGVDLTPVSGLGVPLPVLTAS